MSKTRFISFLTLSGPARAAALPAALLLLLLALSACAPEDKYAATVPVDKKVSDRNPATDPDSEPECPRFDSDYRDRFKSCAIESDCEIVEYAARCSSLRVYAIALAEREAYDECAPESACSRPTSGRTEDGRNIGDLEGLSDVRARCIDGMCEARIEWRDCGSDGEVCNATEICVSFLNDAGRVDYRCAPNPCLGEALDCSCAQAACQFDDRPRICTMEQIDDADVYCKAEGR